MPYSILMVALYFIIKYVPGDAKLKDRFKGSTARMRTIYLYRIIMTLAIMAHLLISIFGVEIPYIMYEKAVMNPEDPGNVLLTYNVDIFVLMFSVTFGLTMAAHRLPLTESERDAQ